MSRSRGRERAQASIEVVALVPALALLLACVWQAALAGLALTAAESASRSGARAALVGRPALDAALAAPPADLVRAGRRAMNARGQASIELVFAAGLAGALALALLPLFQVWQARTRAERIADQAAVLVAEGRPLPGAVTRGARVEVSSGTVRVAVPLAVLGRELEVTATARTP
jgi:hypothetical protein